MLSILRQNRIAIALTSSNYGTYVLGKAINLIGTWMQWIAVGWLAWSLTKSPLWVGLIAFADLFPTVLIGPIAGALADRWDRLKILKAALALAFVHALVLFAFTISGALNEISLLALTSLFGIIIGFYQPARLALIPSLVTPDHLTTAVSFNAVVFNLARFIGPMFAGLVIAGPGPAWVFAINALTYIIFLIFLTRIELTEEQPVTSKHSPFLSQLHEGFTYVTAHGSIAALILLLIVFHICARPMTELLPAFAGASFENGAQALAALTSALGAGAIAGGLWLAQRSSPKV